MNASNEQYFYVTFVKSLGDEIFIFLKPVFNKERTQK